MAHIVLIGPIAAGKSSVAALLSERTGRRNVPLDSVRWFYYYRIGYDYLEERRRVREEGEPGRTAYWKPFEAYAVEQVLADFPDTIIDFGAGHSVHDDEQLLARVQAALAPVPHVILLKPSLDFEESLAILGERVPPQARAHVERLNWTFLSDPSNERLATHTLLTGRRSIEEVGQEVLALLTLSRATPSAPEPSRE